MRVCARTFLSKHMHDHCQIKDLKSGWEPHTPAADLVPGPVLCPGPHPSDLGRPGLVIWGWMRRDRQK